MLMVQNLEVVYDDVMLVLRGISLSVPSGHIVALLGANGAGKSTLLRALSGLLDQHEGRITKGSITLDDKPIHGLRPAAIVRRGVSQVMEGRRIFAELTVEENLRLGGHTRPRDRQDGLTRTYELFPVLAKRRTPHGSGLGRTRWPVERTLAWLHRFRRLAVRYERRPCIHEAFLSLACSLVCWYYLRPVI